MKIKCLNCGFEGEAKRVRPGSLFLEIILWLFTIIGGVIYSIIRSSGFKAKCPRCGNTKHVIKKWEK